MTRVVTDKFQCKLATEANYCSLYHEQKMESTQMPERSVSATPETHGGVNFDTGDCVCTGSSFRFGVVMGVYGEGGGA
jgi:hypothetical protein